MINPWLRLQRLRKYTHRSLSYKVTDFGFDLCSEVTEPKIRGHLKTGYRNSVTVERACDTASVGESNATKPECLPLLLLLLYES